MNTMTIILINCTTSVLNIIVEKQENIHNKPKKAKKNNILNLLIITHEICFVKKGGVVYDFKYWNSGKSIS